MKDLRELFHARSIQYDQLITYGFIKNNDEYIYSSMIDENLKVIITISQNVQNSFIMDVSMNEEYLMVDMKKSKGTYISEVKNRYNELLEDIVSRCSQPDAFTKPAAREIIDYVSKNYGIELEYLWKKDPETAVMRHSDTKKWFGAMMIISADKLGLPNHDKIHIIDVKYPSDKIEKVIDHKTVFEGYHMNKKHWITILLDEVDDVKNIYRFIDESYFLTRSVTK